MRAFFDWLSAPGRATKLLFGGCALAVLLEIPFRFIGHSYDHMHFGFENWFGVHAGWGFLAFAALVAGAHALGAVTRRDEDYYAIDETECDEEDEDD